MIHVLYIQWTTLRSLNGMRERCHPRSWVESWLCLPTICFDSSGFHSSHSSCSGLPCRRTLLNWAKWLSCRKPSSRLLLMARTNDCWCWGNSWSIRFGKQEWTWERPMLLIVVRCITPWLLVGFVYNVTNGMGHPEAAPRRVARGFSEDTVQLLTDGTFKIVQRKVTVERVNLEEFWKREKKRHNLVCIHSLCAWTIHLFGNSSHFSVKISMR